MNNADILSKLDLDSDVERRISLVLDRIRSGNQEILTSPYTKERDPELIFAGLNEIFESNKSKLIDKLIELEESNREKFGPRSLATEWESRKDSLYDSFETDEFEKTFKSFSLGPYLRLRPLSVKESIACMKNNTNSGLPQMQKKKNVKVKYLDYTLERLATSVVDDYFKLACILFTRTQENMKTRNVWGFAFVATLFEMLFYRPILDIQSKQLWRSALRTPDDVSLAMTKLIDYCLSLNIDILSIDFKNYDNSCKPRLQKPAFETVKVCFQKQFHKYIDVISNFFANVGIITPDGVLYGPHGVPSGSTFTNEVDSIIQYGISLECPQISNHELSQVQGDDGVYACIDAKSVMDHFSSYGLNVSVDKSYISRNYAVYLQQLFHDAYRDDKGVINGIYPIFRALNRIIYLEKFDDFLSDGLVGSDYFSIRTICILEQCKHHPLFREFVGYVYSLDKYQLKFSDQGLAGFVKRKAIQDGKDITFRNWTYGDDVAGIKSFDTFKVLQTLRSV